ncbi:hypothetical protein FDP41_002248 [Naegleria fowleri]|uniref:F-box domain-containing protein n=1 Tax=Naegleria fowleri TaxID=5763 RepID=A0A6A5BXD0_NAEFO|nr:uncharacterized protein FDP41_002248 [Naegleria fowleri]KAF0978428.1 hypothetical protein FDP41_002248 [Naegleria fowleri]
MHEQHEEPSRKKKKFSHHHPLEDEQKNCLKECSLRNHQNILLAVDTLVLVGTFLEISDILKSMSRVCTGWNQVFLDDCLWRFLFQRDLGNVDWFLQKLNHNFNDLSSQLCSTSEDSEEEKDKKKNEKPSYKSKLSKKDQTKSPEKKGESKVITSNKDGNEATISLEILQKVLEDCYGENRFWLSLFRLVVAMIPIQNYKMMTDKQIVQPLKNSTPGTRKSKKNNKDKKKKPSSQQKGCSDLFFQKDYIEEEDDDGDYYSNGNRLVSKNYCYFTVRFGEMIGTILSCKSEGTTLLRNALYLDAKTHKLAVILSIFDRHGIILNYFGSDSLTTQNYLNKITYGMSQQAQKLKNYYLFDKEIPALPRTPYISECDQMCVGFKDSHHGISILKFCYSILCGKEEAIYQPPPIQNSSDKSTTENTSQPKVQDDHDDSDTNDDDGDEDDDIYYYDDEDDDEDEDEDDDDEHRKKNIAVGPFTHDAFMPFCKYLLMDHPLFNRRSYAVDDGLNFDYSSGKPGWCCGFWNANFYWYHIARFKTMIDLTEPRIILRVEQDQSSVLQSLC